MTLKNVIDLLIEYLKLTFKNEFLENNHEK